MKTSKKQPPIFAKIKARFPSITDYTWGKGLIIAYGDTVYCKMRITPSNEIHEAVHLKQQAAIGVEVWWHKYLSDDKFRLEQEVEAYRAEFKWMDKNMDRNEAYRIKVFHINNLCSPMYGGIMTKEDAWAILDK